MGSFWPPSALRKRESAESRSRPAQPERLGNRAFPNPPANPSAWLTESTVVHKIGQSAERH